MKLRCHLINEKGHGFVLLESEPQMRSIFIYSQVAHTPYRCPFPYVLFTIKYEKIDNKFVYRGHQKAALKVFFHTTKLLDINDLVHYSPTDYYSRGEVCTPHQHDNQSFDTLDELLKFVVGLWWNQTHVIEYQPFPGKYWGKVAFADISNATWYPAGPLIDHINCGSIYYGSLFVPNNVFLVNEEWPEKSIISPTVIVEKNET